MCAPTKEFVPLPRILDLCLTKTLRQPSLRSWLNPLHYNVNPAVVWGQEGMIIEVSSETEVTGGSSRRMACKCKRKLNAPDRGDDLD